MSLKLKKKKKSLKGVLQAKIIIKEVLQAKIILDERTLYAQKGK
jgi:hypothetical protein